MTLDFNLPVAVLLRAVLHFIDDKDDPAGIVTALAGPLTAGSSVVISHLTAGSAPEAVGGRVYERAEAVQQMLTEAGKHRSAGPVGLLIAATAERERLTVLCDDHDYKVVASVTGQPVQLVTDVDVS